MTQQEHQSQVIVFLESKGFSTLHRSEGCSNHFHPELRVRFDPVYVDSDTARQMFSATRTLLLQDTSMPVASPEHLIALKLFAMHNDESRTLKEFADIQELIPHTDIDMDAVKEYFGTYHLERQHDEFRKAKEGS